ncbi:MAG: hypothetical protein PHD81_00080 [Candidatus Nanoarchaeia archaeon]|nr:hypothetical protein [Candidatus Nanoarchaeia archaeon]MDD5587489.1 hypothetical protein [Candidatus Nanoarchaeia archaeon]
MEIALNGNGKIRVARIEIDVPHLKEIITFGLPFIGPNDYQTVMNKITQEKALRSTTAQTFSLVDLALQNTDEAHCKELLSKFRNNYFWTSTENLWGSENVIVYDNINGKMPSDRKKLLKRFKDGDNSVRVVPYGFKTGSQSISELVKNPYILAQVGDKDFAQDVVARVAEKISKNQPYVFALNPTTQDVKRYTALGSDCNVGGLSVAGFCRDGNGGGYASWVRSQKK